VELRLRPLDQDQSCWFWTWQLSYVNERRAMLIRRIKDGSIVKINAVDSRLKMACEAEIDGNLDKANKFFQAALVAEEHFKD
jgi:hypothetical protein